jgi:4-diphosphocytidyl-2-C-methyl-D-erythritol kinase
MTVRSFAKINLGIEIVGKRPDGYHDIRTLFQTITLADEIRVEPAPDGALDLSGDDRTVAWDATNLVHRAARLLRERTGVAAGARITVSKMVPAGRGLGGGSSNAAATLLALNVLWGLGLDAGGLAPLARGLGADVPFFSKAGSAWGRASGTG